MLSKTLVSEVMAAMGHKGGKIGGKRSLQTMTPEERSERAKKAAAASAEARRNRRRERTPASPREPEASHCPPPMPPVVTLRGWRTKNEALSFADQVLSALHGYARKGSRKRRDYYRNDLQWLTDVLRRVDAGERDPLRPTGQ